MRVRKQELVNQLDIYFGEDSIFLQSPQLSIVQKIDQLKHKLDSTLNTLDNILAITPILPTYYTLTGHNGAKIQLAAFKLKQLGMYADLFVLALGA